ncbi:hypothetical protein KFK09_008631 [Dendrobium nobile]|uniref:CCHC-type domain-containing protein n=1 Tax=Dendrobium nobile TaxID=94219 RepID=A0A8T3BQG8_DENNO|nr:hypothetical protein KFK09_008631 [Dendrobium nobile]
MMEARRILPSDAWKIYRKNLALPVLDSSDVFNGGSKVLENFYQNFKGLKEKPLIINEGGQLNKKVTPVIVPGKGKDVLEEHHLNVKVFSPVQVVKNNDGGNRSLGASSSAGGPIIFSKGVNSKSLPSSPINRDSFSESLKIRNIEDVNNIDVNLPLRKDVDILANVPGAILDNSNSVVNNDVNVKVNSVWSRRPYVKVDNLDLGSFLSEDGKVALFHADKELENAKKLGKALVVKIFGENTPFYVISTDLRRQWDKFGKFHITGLGLGWFLCSFEDPKALESILLGGPWWIRGQVIGLDRWSVNFNPMSLKGITSPVWIRLNNLPLQCWDEVNICRISSLVGKPYLLDGNMFQWSRREYARVCVQIPLDLKLPKGVWVKGLAGVFFQKVEYEGISNICSNCGKIGHALKTCNEVKEKVTLESSTALPTGVVGNQVTKVMAAKFVAEEGKVADNSWTLVKHDDFFNKKSSLPMKKIFLPKTGTSNLKVMGQLLEEQFENNENILNPDAVNNSGVNQGVEILKKFDVLSELTECNEAGTINEIGMEEGEIVGSVTELGFSTPNEGSAKQQKVSRVKDLELPVNIPSLGGIPSTEKNLNLLKNLDPSDLVKGAKKLEVALYLKEMVKDHKVFFIGLLETKINSQDNCHLMKVLGNSWDSFVVPSVGLSGGLMVLWRNDLASFSIVEATSQMILGKLEVHGKGSWIVASIYGNTDAHERRRLWVDIERHCSNELPMIVGGDFNFVVSRSEKRGGSKFTWCNNKNDCARILEKLDRCLINSSTLNILQLAMVKHLSRIASYHCPLLLDIYKPRDKLNREIRYEETWASYHGAAALVKKIWRRNCWSDPQSALNLKLKRTLKGLFYWSKAKFLDLNSLRDKLKIEIQEIQQEEDEGWNSLERLQLLRFKINELNVTLARLNTWWRQRAKARWMDEGDCNSSFFHTFANARRNTNWISHIKTKDGVISEDVDLIQKNFSDFFKMKWQQRKCSLEGWPNSSNVISSGDQMMLDAEFTKEELQVVVDNYVRSISPGLDGITFSFSKTFGRWLKRMFGLRLIISWFQVLWIGLGKRP